mmetsp:Transcript_5450/g.15460  ORF Transcript_5450/g.15460 Transcript_5450/m.15460 type:complete len:239 (+) Transcript_5450:2059-2775(+)
MPEGGSCCSSPLMRSSMAEYSCGAVPASLRAGARSCGFASRKYLTCAGGMLLWNTSSAMALATPSSSDAVSRTSLALAASRSAGGCARANSSIRRIRSDKNNGHSASISLRRRAWSRWRARQDSRISERMRARSSLFRNCVCGASPPSAPAWASPPPESAWWPFVPRDQPASRPCSTPGHTETRAPCARVQRRASSCFRSATCCCDGATLTAPLSRLHSWRSCARMSATSSGVMLLGC